MSLINKMLQDLDARGGTGTRAPSGELRPVAAERGAAKAIAIGAGVGVLIVAAAAGGWYYLQRAAVGPAPVPVAALVKSPPAVAPAPPVPAVVAAVPADPTAPEAAAPAEPVPVLAAPVAAAPATPKRERTVAREAQEGEGAPVAPRRAAAERATERATLARAAVPPPQGVTMTSQQQGESAYRRALAAVQDGRVQDGIAGLEQAVFAYPRHEAARQTLIGLLIETGRRDEAVRHLQLALGLNASQPQLAMLLARLQLEQGGNAVETLQRTLPHAAANADYLAFLAGVLQKGGRHREAAEQYEAALRIQPNNGVWWMGLGISQQAERLRTNAREAFMKAKAAGLSPELREFVDKRLAQLN
ncbi:MSHA biogenesis protein MshN [Pseudoduganella lurida]|uniref:MSHA biogenesis protein MshN n=1 Tax=Pseudoduganella lurida TaxID=1036180 RepID=A0A562RLV7_9BURK|nr:tetratricopeptide repeat protein [Pseudoduganella lurida]TWI69436.1 MSHA biogenesis protein MshN [Pseudoduganella lurida]